MVDVLDVVRDFLIADTTGVYALTGSRIYAGRDVPPVGYTLDDGQCITLKARGGSTAYDDPHVNASIQVKCYGATEYAAETLYRAVYNRLHLGRSTTILHSEIEILGQQLEEPGTQWFFTLAYFLVLVRASEI